MPSSAVGATVEGRLSSVDLGTGQFKLIDDRGRTVVLEQIADPEHAAQLIGQRVVATGTGIRDRRGGIRRMESTQLDGPILPSA